MLPFVRMFDYGNVAPVYENTGKYELQTLTGSLPLSRNAPALCLGNGDIYGYGGIGPGGTAGSTRTDLWRYNYWDNSYWIISSNLDGQRLGAGIGYYKHVLYFMGYNYNSSNSYGSFMTYDLSSGVKKNISGDTGRPTSFAYYEMELVDDTFYVTHSLSSDVYTYTPDTNTWVKRKGVIGFNKASGESKMCYMNGKLYIIGRLYNNFLVQYDISTGSTVNLPAPPNVTNESQVSSFYIRAVQDELYGFVQSTVYKFNFNTNQWNLVNDSNNLSIGTASYINAPIGVDKTSVYCFNDSAGADAGNVSTRVYKIV